MKEKLISVALVLCLLATLGMPVSASEMGELESYGVQLIQYYLHHREKAKDVIWDITRQMKELDQTQGAIWEKLMFDWSWINDEMTVYEDSLPEGLPEDDSLCIVVMGFGLNADGSMRPELVDRLEVARAFALKYPKAFVLVTGGQTGAVDGITEAGQMADWLLKHGLEESRVLRETQSLSTTANAVNCYKLLRRSYPQVNAIAVVTSDYHIVQSCAMFAAVSNYQAGYRGGKRLELVGNAVCDTGLTEDSLMLQAWGISLIFDIPFDENAKAPELYHVDIPEEVYTEPDETQALSASPVFDDIASDAAAKSAEALPEADRNWMIPGAAAVAAVLIVCVLIRRKMRKRNRRKRPKMNWDV